jgi:probable phosphoglycerate mutase
MTNYGTTKKTVYFVRHGESEHNTQPIIQADDSPLSERGHQQAQTVGERLAHLEFDVLVASPTLRARQTAEHIARATGRDIVFSDLFAERRKPTSLESKPWSDEAASTKWLQWEASIYDGGDRIENGENWDDFISRIDNALQYLLDRPEQTIAVVTHGNFLRALTVRALFGDQLNGELLKLFQERARIDNTGASKLLYRDAYNEDFAWQLVTHNDRAHFAE